MEEAQEIFRRAEKASRGSSGFLSSFFSGGPDYDNAIQLYLESGNKYKMLKSWVESCECFNRAADLSLKQNDFIGASNYYTECGNIMKRTNLQKSIPYYLKAVELYNKSGRFSQSGKLFKDIAESLENEYRYEESCEYYKKAADLFDMDEYRKSAYSSCILKYADIVSLCVSEQNDASNLSTDKLYESMKIYEEEAKKALGNSLIKYNAKEYLFKSFLIVLSLDDPVDAQIKFDKYSNIDQSFRGSQQGKLCSSILGILEKKQKPSDEQEDSLYRNSLVEEFTQVIEEYNSIYPFDDWKVHFLSIVKKNLSKVNINITEKTENNEFDLT
ncbi:hypothetical protein FG386_001836 [Cryptosporidium ryanae]|uniref:uncharacterized protein n=1 Tax=Cryptosporidium ryanae TaxID=515981 RepID=UPI00351AADB9|nr:hypothetical protein FG386_001836 [Cryptosporidium ryanae]